MIKCKHLFPTWCKKNNNNKKKTQTCNYYKTKTFSTNHPKQKHPKIIRHKDKQATLIKKIGYSVP